MKYLANIVLMSLGLLVLYACDISFVEDVEVEIDKDVVAGESASIDIEFPEEDNFSKSFTIAQTITYTDPDGTEREFELQASVDVAVHKNLISVEEPYELISADTSSVFVHESYDEWASQRMIQQKLTMGNQEVMVTMKSSERSVENSLGQTVRLPSLNLRNVRLVGVKAEIDTEKISGIGQVPYKVTASFEVEAEMCNVEAVDVRYIGFKIMYDGLASGKELSSGNPLTYMLKNFHNHDGDEQMSWLTMTVPDDALDVVNGRDFLDKVSAAINMESGHGSDEGSKPYFVFSEPELIDVVQVDSTDIYPDSSVPSTRSMQGARLYSQTVSETLSAEPAASNMMTPGAANEVTAEDMYRKYPHVKDLSCPERAYTMMAKYMQTATLMNSDSEYSFDFCYDVTLAGKTKVELKDVEYDSDVEFGIFPTIAANMPYTKVSFFRKRSYSTGEELVDSFEGSKVLLFGLSTATIRARETWSEPSENWSDADALGRNDPALIEALFDAKPYYSYYRYDAYTTYSYEWGAGIDWDQVRDDAVGEVSVEVGTPFLDGSTYHLSGLGFVGNDIRDSQLGIYTTYYHSELTANGVCYDEDVKIPGWYSGFLQSRHTLLVETGDYDRSKFANHNIWYPARLSIDLCFNHKVMCLDDKILVAKYPIDDTVVEASFEEAVSPAHGPVRVAKLHQDVNIYGKIYKFDLRATLYNYKSPHYQWE